MAHPRTEPTPLPAAKHQPIPSAHGQHETSSSIVDALALRTTLREALIKTNDLIRSIKRQKRQSRLVVSTLASLKQLQKVAG